LSLNLINLITLHAIIAMIIINMAHAATIARSIMITDRTS